MGLARNNKHPSRGNICKWTEETHIWTADRPRQFQASHDTFQALRCFIIPVEIGGVFQIDGRSQVAQVSWPWDESWKQGVAVGRLTQTLCEHKRPWAAGTEPHWYPVHNLRLGHLQYFGMEMICLLADFLQSM